MYVDDIDFTPRLTHLAAIDLETSANNDRINLLVS